MAGEKRKPGFLITVGGCAILFSAFSILGFSCLATGIGMVADGATFRNYVQEQRFTEVHREGSQVTNQKLVIMKLSGTMIENGPGTLYSQGITQKLLDMIKSAKDDSTVAGVLLRLDSPGGSVTDADALLMKIRELADTKPVLFLMDGICASGCVYAAIGASEIWALPTSITGSIGVIINGLNISDFLSRHGIEDRSITSGKHKALLSPTRPVDEEGRQIVQGIVDAMYSRFINLVSRHRKIPLDDLKKFADGRILTAEQAKDHKLIDQVGYSDAALDRLRELAQVQDDTQVVQYVYQPTIYEFLQQNFSENPFDAKIFQHLNSWPQVMLLPAR